MKKLLLAQIGVLFFILNSLAQSPNIVIINADIRTMDKLKPRAEAIAITGNKISAVGTDSEIRKLIEPNTRIVDAKGKLIIPGFNDSHVHFFSIGVQFFSVNLKDFRTSEQVITKLKLHAKFLPQGKWLIGNFQTKEDYPLQIIPRKEAIDAVTPNHPVLIFLKGVEIVFANSHALRIAGIDTNSNGILRGNAVNLIRRRIPATSYNTDPAVAETATNYAASVGVTSVQDVHSDDSFEIYQQLKEQGKLKTRVYDCILLKEQKALIQKGISRASGDEIVRRGCLKYYADGDPEQLPDLIKMAISADKADLQVMMHAIGQSANNIALAAFEEVLKNNGEKDRRFRIEHAHNFRFQDLKRFAATKTIASMQPFLFFNQSGDYSRLFRTMINEDVLFSLGSDANITELNPLWGIYAAVYGEKPIKGISVEEVVRAYTLGAAYAEFQENVKGSITAGKLADLVLLSDDIFTIAPVKIKDTKVLLTIMDGKVVFENLEEANQ